jgi:hypothetical protein
MVVHTYILKLVNSSNKKNKILFICHIRKVYCEEPFSILNKDRTESFDGYIHVERKEDVN